MRSKRNMFHLVREQRISCKSSATKIAENSKSSLFALPFAFTLFADLKNCDPISIFADENFFIRGFNKYIIIQDSNRYPTQYPL